MPKSRKNSQRRKRRHNQTIASQDGQAEAALRERTAHVKWVLLSLVTVILIAILINLHRMNREEVYRRVPLVLRVIFIGAMCLLTAKATLVGLAYFSGRRTWRQLDKLLFWDFITSVFILSVVILVLSFLYGFPDKISAGLTYIIPNASEKIINALSYILNIIVSGILGNFAYQMVKRLTWRLARRSNQALHDASSLKR